MAYHSQMCLFNLQVPSAPPTYTGRQLWWARRLERRCMIKKKRRRSGCGGREGRLQVGLDLWEWIYNADACRALSLCTNFSTVTLTVCQSMYVCVWERKQFMEDRAKLFLSSPLIHKLQSSKIELLLTRTWNHQLSLSCFWTDLFLWHHILKICEA